LPAVARWVAERELFFVGTVPTAGDGHANISPKGPVDSLRILDERTLEYLDVVESGAETIAHLRENGRGVSMSAPSAARLASYDCTGAGVCLRPAGQASKTLRDGFPRPLGVADDRALRTVIRIDVARIADSCSFGVPLMGFSGFRAQYMKAFVPVGADGRLAHLRYQVGHVAKPNPKRHRGRPPR